MHREAEFLEQGLAGRGQAETLDFNRPNSRIRRDRLLEAVRDYPDRKAIDLVDCSAKGLCSCALGSSQERSKQRTEGGGSAGAQHVTAGDSRCMASS
jgi:hypothetical protein